MLDALLAEYPWPSYLDRHGRLRGPDDYIIWKLPLARAFAHYATIGPRYGGETKGMTYVEQAMVQARRAFEASQSQKEPGQF